MRRSLAAEWDGIGSATVSDCLGRAGAMDGAISLLSGDRLVARAYPIRVLAGDSLTIHRALEKVHAGSVLVVSAEAHTKRAVWGEVMTVAAQRAGVVGIVVDGSVRDIGAIRERGFVVFARGTSPAGPHKGGHGSTGVAISCGGVVVEPGDVVLGDHDGVVVVPAAEAEQVRAAAVAKIAQEREWIERIEGGEPSAQVLGFGSDLRPDPS